VRTRPGLALAALVAALAGCATPATNVKLDRQDPNGGYRYEQLAADDNSDELFVILAFSGGGTRAAAFSFGVMEALRDVDYRSATGRRRLLSDVDVIASVSGGSFTAAYYALFPDTFFTSFPEEFLHRNIERALILRALAPWNWLRLIQPDFDRIHLAVELYDETVFHGKTFGAIQRKPFVILNATDMTLGRRFEFTQEQFDLLCSDVSQTKVAAGVAASSAFPGLLSPLTLKNFAAEGCGFQPPEWLPRALVRGKNPLERYARARDLWSYQDPASDRRFIHLLDGGLADNIGLRGPYVALKSSTDTGWSVLARVSQEKTRRVVVITANAKTRPARDWDQHAAAPGLLSVLSLVASGPMDNYSFDSVQMVRDLFREQSQEYDAWKTCHDTLLSTCGRDPRNTVLPPVDYHAVELAFETIDDDRVRRCLENLPTSFALTRPQVTLLRQAARSLLMASTEFRAAMAAIDPTWQPPDVTLDPALIAEACPGQTPQGVSE
jgi:NTE family protein